MKKLFLLFVMLLSMSMLSMGQTPILYEDFNYTPPANIGGTGTGTTNNNWATHSGTVGTIDVISGNLSYPGLATSSGYKVYSAGPPVTRDVNRAFTTTETSLYFSAIINVVDNTSLGASFDYFMHFCQTAGTTSVTVFAGRLGAKSVNSGANYRLGILNTSGGTSTYTEYATDLSFGTSYLVVVKVNRSSTPIVASLWVNPTSLGGAEPTGSISNNIGTGALSAFASIGIRNGSTTPKVEIDEIRVGSTWASVTPTGTLAAPTVQTSNLTFSGVSQTQMDVSWTSGNGMSRIVKINTTNSFTAPVDNTNYPANSVYSGSGEQVIYNGSGTTIPTVSGLTAGTTYYFQAWEYNSGIGTYAYCTATGANNPASQTTASTPTAPLVVSPTATSIKATSAVLGGTIASDGGSAILERGTLWSLSTPVTISDNKLVEGGTSTGVFSQLHGGMPANTLIYYAAYATNGIGTTISSEGTFTTLLSEPTNHVLNFTATAPSSSNVVVTWSDNMGTQAATGFLILANKTGIFTDPVDGVPVANYYALNDSSAATNVLPGVQTFNWFGLVGSTHFYFKIYPYTNSGTNIDYKTSPAAPEADATTLVFVPPVAAWTFDLTPIAPNTPLTVAAEFGDQASSAMLYADGTNGSSAWLQASELAAFSGTTLNDPREGSAILAGLSYCPLAGGTGTPANGKSMVIKFSMSALQDAVLTFATRWSSSTAFNNHQWAWSTDGVNFTNFGENTAPTTTTFALRTLDLSTLTAINGAPSVYLKVTFSGATSGSSNNRLDNIVIRANAATTLPPTVATLAATDVQETTATLNGSVNPNNQSATVSFEYGTSTSYGNTVDAVPSTVSGGTTSQVSAPLSGLQFNTTYHFRVVATNTSGTSYGEDVTFTTSCPVPGDAGNITGSTEVCANSTSYDYYADPITYATTYLWTVPSGATIISGDGTDHITVQYTSGSVSGFITVFGSNDCGDGNAASIEITVTEPVVASVSITASANPVAAGTSVTYTAVPVNGGAAPTYTWKINNTYQAPQADPSYTYIPSNGDVILCIMASGVTCVTGSPATSNEIVMTVTSTPENLTVNGSLVAPQAVCYNATNTITVAGSGTEFHVGAGASATMIAGSTILYLPGTHVASGAYMHGYIAPSGPWCPSAPVVKEGEESQVNSLTLLNDSFRIYPNPTSGTFTIENYHADNMETVTMEVVSLVGKTVMKNQLMSAIQNYDLRGHQPGLYFVRLTAGNHTETVRLILTK